MTREQIEQEILRKELLYAENPSDYLLLQIQILYLKLEGKIGKIEQ